MNRSGVKKNNLSDLLLTADIEVMPMRGVEKQLECLGAGARVAITCSPSKGIEPTLKLVESLNEQGFQVIPHLAARQVASKGQLQEILGRLLDCGVKTIFVPAGDINPPVGEFDSTLQLLQAMADINHGINEIGVAAYPEGHPFIDEPTLIALLRAKQDLASYCVTQMCFSADAIIGWLARICEQGIRLPIRIGLPGAVERKKLFGYSLRIGVADSARFSLRQPMVIRKLMATRLYQPDDLLLQLAPYLDNARSNIAGLHLYTFNQVEATQSWRAGFLNDMRQQKSG